MSLSPETKKAIAHYCEVRELIGAEDLADLKAFCEWFSEQPYQDLPQQVADGFGLLCDIMDPQGIAEQDEGFLDGDPDADNPFHPESPEGRAWTKDAD